MRYWSAASNLAWKVSAALAVPGGANIRAFAEVPSKSESRALLGLQSDVPVVCFSGLDVLIDLPLAVQAFEYCFSATRARYYFLRDQQNATCAAWFQMNPLWRMSKRWVLLHTSCCWKYLAAADVFLMPYSNKVSNVGRWPNKVGDYMCVGRPTA